MFRKIHLWQINSQEKLKVNMKLISKSEIDQRCKIPFPTPPNPESPMSVLTLNLREIHRRLWFFHSSDRSGGHTGSRTAQGFRSTRRLSLRANFVVS